MCVCVCVVECAADMKFTTTGRRESYTVTRKRYGAHDYKVSCSRSHLCSLTCFRYLTCLLIVSKWCVAATSERLISMRLAEADSKEAGIFICFVLSRFHCYFTYSIFVAMKLTQSVEYLSVFVLQEECMYIVEMCDIQK